MNEELTELNYRRQISRQHLDILAEYMERYPSLALASARSREGHTQSKRMWEKIARTLNKIDETVTKSGRCWSRYWADLKFKIRRKYAVVQRCRTEGTHCSIHLSPLEQRLVKVLTDEDGNLLPTSSVYHQLRYGQINTSAKYNGNSRIKSKVVNEENDNLEDSGGEVPDDGPDDYLTLNNLVTDLHEVKPNIKADCMIPDPIHIVVPEEDRKTIDELRRDLVEFELRKQKELFEMEKQQRREKHELEVAILRLRKQVMMKELKKF